MHTIVYRGIVLSVLAVLMSACAILPSVQEPLPVSSNSAVVALVDKARTDMEASNWEGAGATLERALRIESRNAVLWHELAQVRLQQGYHSQAASLAAKSNGWAAENRALRAANWRIIGEVRSQSGDWEGAQAAFDKAVDLEK